jgi:hypothetical protein
MPWGKDNKESGNQEEYGTQELRKIEKCDSEEMRNGWASALQDDGDALCF